MRSALRHSYLSIAGMFNKPSRRTHFLNGHYVSALPVSVENQRKLFRELLTQMSAHSTLIDPQTGKERLKQKDKALIALTFDDGFSDVKDVICPVLEEFNLVALFFVNPAYLNITLPDSRLVIDKFYKRGLEKSFLSAADVKELHRRGHVIGSHGLSHIRLSTVSGTALAEEIIKSKQMLEDITGAPCVNFAYPFGGVNDITHEGILLALDQYETVFSSTTQSELWSQDGRIINRRHFEGNWPSSHIRYFLSRRE